MPDRNESPKTAMSDLPDCWPRLPLASWKDTYATLHMWTQIVGKVRLALTPRVNHWWNVPLYVSARGLTTTAIPYAERTFELRFDFLNHELVLETSDGQVKSLPLFPRPVADFYQAFMSMLHSAGIEVKIWKMPSEVPDPIPFDQDRAHASYGACAVEESLFAFVPPGFAPVRGDSPRSLRGEPGIFPPHVAICVLPPTPCTRTDCLSSNTTVR